MSLSVNPPGPAPLRCADAGVSPPAAHAPNNRMSISQKMRSLKNQFLAPGSVAVAKPPGTLTTIVSNGIAVCLWDPMAELGGMVHFVMAEGSGDTRCCKPALAKLCDELKRLGANPERMVAHLYGGCHTLYVGCTEKASTGCSLDRCPMNQGGPGATHCLGEQNRRAAESWLRGHGIEVAAGECGGPAARRVIFSPLTGYCHVEPVVLAKAKIA